MTEESVNINGLNIYYKVLGEGKPLLILHGWGSISDRWITAMKLLAGRRFKVILPDLPGFGKSDIPERVWNLDDYSNFVKEFVNYLELNNFYLLGHSFGGNIAIKYSLINPNKIKKMFLSGPACIRRESLKVKLLYYVSKIFKFIGFIPFAKNIFYKFIKSDYHFSHGLMRKTYLKIIKEDLTDILPDITVPTILIWGDKDDLTPIKGGNLMHKKIKNSEMEVIPNANHNLHSECPGLLADVISKN